MTLLRTPSKFQNIESQPISQRIIEGRQRYKYTKFIITLFGYTIVVILRYLTILKYDYDHLQVCRKMVYVRVTLNKNVVQIEPFVI